jgi:FkbM family methyltransferase
MTVFGTVGAKVDVAYLYSEIFEQGCYERHGIELPQAATVIDVGANVGLFTLRVLERAPGATVYCIEPAPPTFACLAKNVAHFPGVQTFNVALMAEARSLEIAFYPRSPGNSTLYPNSKPEELQQFAQNASLKQVWGTNKLAAILLALVYPFRREVARYAFRRMLHGKQTFTCRAMTLDHLFEQQGLTAVDLLKVDVEGAEPDVFAGMSDAYLRRVRQIVVEISSANKPWIPSLERRLRDAGFDRVVFESIVSGGEPRSDVFPCSLYAART